MPTGILQLNTPVLFVECGRFISDHDWTHKDSTRKSEIELLIGINGSVPLNIGNTNYLLNPGKVLYCFPTETITGSAPATNGA
ncbi:hypothetical protein [Lentilactobacillus sp. Marseille-Q4993]|uniref:hypothetical protein n=1 Tax=Lentilactobacillus sp. Marseille-Q4993 TaxID=3039492 RepID=UPI0024BD4D45|nr:hypothetical protein [Lentilactobacillus sp. Marseille-Q4993]